MYDMTSTRPDIAFVVGKLSRFTSNPSTLHSQPVRRVLKFIKKNMDYGLTYVGFRYVIKGYSDACWITNIEGHSSTSGWMFLLGGCAISRASKKQTCITNSTRGIRICRPCSCWERSRMVKEFGLWNSFVDEAYMTISLISIHCDSVVTFEKVCS